MCKHNNFSVSFLYQVFNNKCVNKHFANLYVQPPLIWWTILSFSSGFGPYQILREVFDSLAAKCSTMFSLFAVEFGSAQCARIF